MELSLISNPKCTQCDLHEYPKSVCIPTTHLPNSLGFPASSVVMFIGQNPGFYEDQKNEPFVGRSGKLVREAYVGGTRLNEQASIFLANGVRCHTESNEVPKPRHYVACQNYLESDLDHLLVCEKNIVVTLGAPATTSFYKNVLDLRRVSLTESFNRNGNSYEWKGTPFNLFSTYHPAAVIRNHNLINTVSAHMQLVHDCLMGTMASPSDPDIVPTRSPRKE